MTPPNAPGSKPDCIFCRIVAGDAPSHRVFEDDEVLVFMDIQPVAAGHTLVIPKRHCDDLFEASEDSMAAVARVSVRIARAIRAALEPDGVFVAQANGAAAGQTVFHYHLHLIPRKHGESRRIFHGRRPEGAEQLAATCARIRAHLG